MALIHWTMAASARNNRRRPLNAPLLRSGLVWSGPSSQDSQNCILQITALCRL